jgi:quercetin dioxygenase-like cupin family protein
MNKEFPMRTLVSAFLFALCFTTSGAAQSGNSQAPTYKAPGGTTLRLLLDERNVGADAAVGEMMFPANSDSGDHQHGALEMFYVLSGEYEHVVNGRSYVLKPGMTGYVRPPDTVRHKAGPAGAKVLVIWVPGAEEAKRLTSRWSREP